MRTASKATSISRAAANTSDSKAGGVDGERGGASLPQRLARDFLTGKCPLTDPVLVGLHQSLVDPGLVGRVIAAHKKGAKLGAALGGEPGGDLRALVRDPKFDWGGGGGQVQAKSEGGSERGVGEGATTLLDRAAQGPGTSVDGAVAARFASATGADVSGVRVHTGSDSAEAARSIQALAYTTGQDVHFGAGQYKPGTAQGDHLIAHELAHTVQQGTGGGGHVQGRLEVSQPGDAHEVEADRVADAVVGGGTVEGAMVSAGTVSRRIMREADPDETFEMPAPDIDGHRADAAKGFTQSSYGTLPRGQRVPMVGLGQTRETAEAEWAAEVPGIANRMRTFLRQSFGEDRDLRVTSIVKAGEHYDYRKFDVALAGATTWEELAAAAVYEGVWVHAEGVTLAGKLWPLSPKATGPHLDLYRIGKPEGELAPPEAQDD